MKVKLHPLNVSYISFNRISTLRRYYSTSNAPNANLPEPIFVLSNLDDKSNVLSKRGILYKKGGIYCFINKVNQKQYIGSAKDIFLRLNEHLSNRKSNSALQAAISKYGLNNFNFCVYEYFTYENKLISNKLLTDL